MTLRLGGDVAVTHRETSPWVQDGGESQPPSALALWWGGVVVGTPLHLEFGDAMACPAAGMAGEGSSPPARWEQS